MALPNWVKKHRQAKTEIKDIGGRFYVYEVSSIWDAKRKITKKLSGKLLGKITKEDRFIERGKYQKQKIRLPILSKEYGASELFKKLMNESTTQLQELFPEQWQQIVISAYARLLHQSPLKNIELHYEHSFLSEMYPQASVGSKVIGQVIQILGTKREQIRKFFKSIKNKGELILIDGTNILNNSAASLAEIGYNSTHTYRLQVNLLYIFDKKSQSPMYYRLVPGNIREVKSFQLSLKESGLTNAVIVADKGFYSKDNIKELEDSNLSYIIPLQRSSSLIDYTPLQPLDKKKMSGYFIYAKRTIWFYKTQNVTLFLDEELKLAEERDYLNRIVTHPEKYSIDQFHEKQHVFGTMAIIANAKKVSSEVLYNQYKSRASIEQLFDSFKNLLEADRTYMRTDEGLEGWMFINFIALSWYYKIYALLLEKNLLSKFSVADVLERATKIKKISINDEWFTSEITTKSRKLFQDINCPVT